MATNAICLFAEYMCLSDVSPVPRHILVVLNVDADDVLRVQELFVPKLKSIYHFPIIFYFNRFYKSTAG